MQNDFITIEEISQTLNRTGLPKMDRHVIGRLSQAGFLTRIDNGIGLPSLFPKESINALKALSLASICIYGYGPGSRVDNKNTLFYIAKAIAKSFAYLRTREERSEKVIMKDFISVLNNMPQLSTIAENGKISLIGYIIGDNGNYMLFNSIPEEQASLVKKTLDKDGMHTIKHFAVAYFYFIEILEGHIVENMYDNTKAFIEFLKDTPTPSGIDTSVASASYIKPLGDRTKAFIPANLNKLKTKTTSLLSVYEDKNDLNMVECASEAAHHLTTVLGLLSVLDIYNGNKKDVNSWLEFILRCDNHTLWLTKEVVKPALIKIGCNIEAFDARTIFLAAEFMANIGYLQFKA